MFEAKMISLKGQSVNRCDEINISKTCGENEIICSHFNTKTLKPFWKNNFTKYKHKKVTRNFEFMSGLLKFKLLNVIIMRLEELDFIRHPQLDFLSSWILLRQLYTFHTHSNTYVHQRKEMRQLKWAACNRSQLGSDGIMSLCRGALPHVWKERNNHVIGSGRTAACYERAENDEEGNRAYRDNAPASAKSPQLIAEQSRGGGLWGINAYHLWKLVSSLCNSFSVVAVHYKDQALEGEKNIFFELIN